MHLRILLISSTSNSDSLQPKMSDSTSGRSPSLTSPARRACSRCSDIRAEVNYKNRDELYIRNRVVVIKL